MCTEIAQERYKKNADKSVRVNREYSSDNYVFVDVPAGHTSKADVRAQETLKTLQPRKNGRFKVTSVQSHTITLNEDGTKKTVFIDRESLAKGKGEVDQSAPKVEH